MEKVLDTVADPDSKEVALKLALGDDRGVDVKGSVALMQGLADREMEVV
jgi:hypothetical protein